MLRDVRGLSTVRLLVFLVVGLVVTVAVGLVVFGQPSVTGVDNRFGEVNETTTVVESDVYVRNPTPVGANLDGLTVDYAIDMNGIRMAEGTKEGVSVGLGRTAVPMQTSLANDRIPAWWVSHIRNDEETTLAINADVHSSTVGATFGAPKVSRSIETDIISQFNSTETRPVGDEDDPALYINETSAEWGTVNQSVTAIDMTMVVYNPNPYPVPVSELSYRMTMNDVEMGSGVTEGQGVIPPKSTKTLHTTTRIRNDHIDEWWVSHLQNDQTTDLRIDFAARLQLAGRTVDIPLDALTYTRTIDTDIFGNKEGGSNGGTGTPSDTATGTGTPTQTDDDGGLLGGSDGGTATATPTSTASGDGGTETVTPTQTPSPPATDDGLLRADNETTTADGPLVLGR